MPDSSKPASDSKTQLWLAAIGVVSALGVAVISNWKSIFATPAPGLDNPSHSARGQNISTSLQGKTVYIFISSEVQRNDANALLRRLTDNSAKVYEVENLVRQQKIQPENTDHSFPEGSIHIRYFYMADLGAAKIIHSLTQRNQVTLDIHVEDSRKNDEGTIEVWYPWLKS